MDGVKVFLLEQPFVTLHVPGHVAGLSLDALVGWRGDKAFFSLFEIPLVSKRQRSAHAILQIDRELGGFLALGIKVLGRICRNNPATARGKCRNCHRQGGHGD